MGIMCRRTYRRGNLLKFTCHEIHAECTEVDGTTAGIDDDDALPTLT